MWMVLLRREIAQGCGCFYSPLAHLGLTTLTCCKTIMDSGLNAVTQQAATFSEWLEIL